MSFTMERQMEEYYRTMGYVIPPKYSSDYMKMYEMWVCWTAKEAFKCGV